MAAGDPVFPSGSNTFVKDHAATGGMIINYSRNIEDFALNSYIQIRKVSTEAGYYLKLTVEEAGRILNSGLQDFVWFDGQERPLRNEGTESFVYLEYKTQRNDFGYNLGDKAVNQAGWDIVAVHNAIKAQQAMTARTQRVFTEVSTTGNHDTNHFSAVSSISGNTGTWAASTTQRQDIKRSLNFAADLISQDTLDVVKPDDLVVVFGPDTARDTALSQEIVDHIKHSDHALAQIRGELPGRNVRYGLPDKLYGYPIFVDGTTKTTSKKNATRAVARVWTSGTAAMLSRPGSLAAEGGGPSFSSVTLFAFEEMTVETLRDERNRRIEAHVVEDLDAVLTATAASFLFTAAV